MRHRKAINHLSRTSSHRKSMLGNMAVSLLINKKIKTTIVKAKALKTFIEPLITKSKDDTIHSRRIVFSRLQDKNAVSELFRVVSPKIAERPGGYTRILKTGSRLGDRAEMCIIELVDFNELLLKETKKETKTRRTRRGGAKAAEKTVAVKEPTASEAVEESQAAEVVEETPATEVAEETQATKTPEVTEEAKVPEEEKKEEDKKTDE